MTKRWMKTCKRCHAEYDASTRHMHCRACGVLGGSGQPHIVELHAAPGSFCPTCKRLLAPGAQCPAHPAKAKRKAASTDVAPPLVLEIEQACKHHVKVGECSRCREEERKEREAKKAARAA